MVPIRILISSDDDDAAGDDPAYYSLRELPPRPQLPTPAPLLPKPILACTTFIATPSPPSRF